MFFVLSFDLIDRRHLAPTQAGLAFLPFTLGVGLLSRPFGAVADKIGARVDADCRTARRRASRSYGWRSAATPRSRPACWRPLGLLGLAFAVLVAPLTAAVLSSVADADEGLASGINNAMSRVAQLAGVALAAGLASYASGFAASMIGAAVLAAGGAGVMAVTVPRRAGKRESAMSRKLPAHARHPQGDAERARLRGMPEDRLALGASAPVPHLRPCRLLRSIRRTGTPPSIFTPPAIRSSKATIRRKAGAGAMWTKPSSICPTPRRSAGRFRVSSRPCAPATGSAPVTAAGNGRATASHRCREIRPRARCRRSAFRRAAAASCG